MSPVVALLIGLFVGACVGASIASMLAASDPRRRDVGPPVKPPRATHVPSLSDQVEALLLDAGADAGVLEHWWGQRRRALDGLTPFEALGTTTERRRLLALAKEDAADMRAQVGAAAIVQKP